MSWRCPDCGNEVRFNHNGCDFSLSDTQSSQWAEYRAHGGKLDFTAWQEKRERESA